MKKLITSILLSALFLGCSGCAGRAKTIKGQTVVPVIEDGVLSLTTLEQELLVVVGFAQLEDKRPKEDIAYMTSVREKVSTRVLDILKSINLFDEIHSPAYNEDTLIISGEIRRFGWESFDTMISYIPGLNVLPFLGLPSSRVDSGAEIYLIIKNNKTNQVILEINESHSERRKYNIYNFQQEKAEADLANCFNIVLERIRKKIIYNRDKILKEVKTVTVSVPPKQETEVKAEVKVEAPKEVKLEKAPKEEALINQKVVVPEEVVAPKQKTEKTE
ncbi:MAG: hypothetical protein ABIA97_04510 [Candidatus Omnitrophota bacterium]